MSIVTAIVGEKNYDEFPQSSISLIHATHTDPALCQAYSYSDPNCRNSPLELDNSRLSLDENCHILDENYTTLVSFISNSRWRITGEIHILCQRLQELQFST